MWPSKRINRNPKAQNHSSGTSSCLGTFFWINIFSFLSDDFSVWDFFSFLGYLPPNIRKKTMKNSQINNSLNILFVYFHKNQFIPNKLFFPKILLNNFFIGHSFSSWFSSLNITCFSFLYFAGTWSLVVHLFCNKDFEHLNSSAPQIWYLSICS